MGSIEAFTFSSVRPCDDISAHNFSISSLMSSPSEETNSFSFGRMLSTMYEKNACADAPFCKQNKQNNLLSNHSTLLFLLDKHLNVQKGANS